MGTWGTGPFENDDAVDWVSELYDGGGIDTCREALRAATVEGYLEMYVGAAAIAAAEIIAAAVGRASSDLPGEFFEWLIDNDDVPTSADITLARNAVERISGEDSEVADLWQDARDASWASRVEELLVRLAD
ncbi:MAG: DUF4259 domain-containing protein [Acidobacteria bacterium]|nr:DUF4259 domain-containing protein [Acidobacteriota bacterium]